KGDRTAFTSEDVEHDVFKVIDAEGGAKEEKKDKVTVRAYRETVLEKAEGKKATKLRREYEKARVKEKGKERTLPYEGKTVLIEKKGDKYEFEIEGGKPLTGKDAEELEKEFNEHTIDAAKLDKLMLPPKPVAVGESWKIDAAAVVKELLGGDDDDAIRIDAAK